MADAIKPSQNIARLIEIMAALRTPATGCPWDLEQSFETIAPYTIEEAYEVADAIARNDLVELKDELGDLLLQVVYHARLAEEQGVFSFGDVVDAITRKMIRRHPHVFGERAAHNPAEVKVTWDKTKAEERAEKAAQHAAASSSPRLRDEGNASILADVPLALPALTRAIKLQDKAAKVGFDWPNLAPVFAKLKEEIAEFEEVALPADPRTKEPSTRAAPGGRLYEGVSPGAIDKSALQESAIKEEFGDMLFVMANIARHLKLDPESALREANQKFIRRFAHIEASLAERGRTPAQSSLAEMDALWDEVRAREKAKQPSRS